MEQMDMKSMNVIENNIKKIKELFPDVVSEIIVNGETKLTIDFDSLKEELGAAIDTDKKERYQMSWPDKNRAKLLANSQITATLRPDINKSVNFDETKNLYIEGDNLDVLKLLRETYLGKVKMIYIDPPYNTGNDFVYADDFSISVEEYMTKSGQISEEGGKLFHNTESNGRFHTDWLNMIYPRLKIARDLLTDDGIIFISIDDAEVYNLKKVCDEIFGESNFVCNFIRKNKAGSGHDSASIAIEFDYILCYSKNIKECTINQEIVDISKDTKYKLQDEYVERRGKYYLRDLDYRGSYSEGLDYPIKTPEGTIIYSGGKFGKPNTWRWGKTKFDWGMKNGYIVFQKKADGWKVYIKQYQYVDNNDEPYKRTIPYRALVDFSNGQGSIECGELLGNNVFSYPKSTDLLCHLLKIGTQKDSLVLDFFSGSATTAHAVMKLNAEDGGSRRFILVQLPEVCDVQSEAYTAGYANICEIGEERIRRAGKLIKEENPNATNLDVGFRVLKLDSSNMQDVYYNPSAMTQTLLDATIDNVKPDRTPLDLLFQVMLDLGIELSARITEKQVNDKIYYTVNDNDIIACFDDNIDNDVITEIAKRQPLYAVFKDKSFATDSVGINNEQLFKTYSPATVIKVI